MNLTGKTKRNDRLLIYRRDANIDLRTESTFNNISKSQHKVIVTLI